MTFAPPLALALALSGGFADSDVWDDGKAEVSTYDAERVIYGLPRKHEARLIVVKEDHEAGRWIKADPPYGDREIVPVLKLNHVRTVPTENYDYHLMTSAFVLRSDPTRAPRVTTSSQEWCGVTHKTLVEGTLRWSSYFDAEGEGERETGLRPGDLIRDALPVQLRALPFAPGLERKVRVLDLLTDSHAGGERVRGGVVRVVGEETVETGDGAIASWKVELTVDGAVDRLWFAKDRAHVLTRLAAADGRTLRLREHRRHAYWER